MILVLGGTAEARALAAALVSRGREVTSSLAGRVSEPALPAGAVRVGGFGGVEGLVGYLQEHRVDALVDATHPFAATISAHAAAAAGSTGCPLVRLERTGWRDHPAARSWTWVRSVAAVLDLDGERPFLTTGRQSLAQFLPWADRAVLARVVDPPTSPLPERWRLLRSRGPYEYAGERRTMLDHRTDLLVTKDSGGTHTSAKLDVAADLGIPVAVVERPSGPAGVETVATVGAALTWLEAHAA